MMNDKCFCGRNHKKNHWNWVFELSWKIYCVKCKEKSWEYDCLNCLNTLISPISLDEFYDG